jgi:hypothetical protein
MFVPTHHFLKRSRYGHGEASSVQTPKLTLRNRRAAYNSRDLLQPRVFRYVEQHTFNDSVVGRMKRSGSVESLHSLVSKSSQLHPGGTNPPPDPLVAVVAGPGRVPASMHLVLGGYGSYVWLCVVGMVLLSNILLSFKVTSLESQIHNLTCAVSQFTLSAAAAASNSNGASTG